MKNKLVQKSIKNAIGWMQKSIKRIVAAVLATVFLLAAVYALIGVFPYFGASVLDNELKASLSAESFYSDNNNGEYIMMLDDPVEAFEHRLNIINLAQYEIFFCTFLIYEGEKTDILFGSILDAASRGVRITFLIDMWFPLEQKYMNVLVASSNIDFFTYSERSALNPQRAVVSMHDKFMIVDKTYMIFGGRNIGNEYFEHQSNGSKMTEHDREVLIFNDNKDLNNSIGQTLAYGNELINSSFTKHKTQLSKKQAELATTQAKQMLDSYSCFDVKSFSDYSKLCVKANKITLVTNGSDGLKKNASIAYALLDLARKSNDIVFETPFIGLKGNNLKQFSEAIENKSAVMLCNSTASTHDLFGFGNYIARRRQYLRTGLKIYEFQSNTHSIHSKTYVFDDRISVIGSFNLTERSININNESMLFIDSAEFNAITRQTLSIYLDESLMVDPNKNIYVASDKVEKIEPAWNKTFSYYFVGFIFDFARFLY